MELAAGVSASGTAIGAVSDAAARVAASLLAMGPATAQALATHLSTTTVAVGRHLDHLEAAGWVCASEHAPYGPGAVVRQLRGRGRPARVWSLTAVGRRGVAGPGSVTEEFAAAAVAFLDARAGTEAVAEFARSHADRCAQQWRQAEVHDVESLAQAMTAQGYAAVTTALPEAGAVQLCQHNCPIETVARAHPEFCEAETKAISHVLGRNVVRLSTISGGGHICTTLVPPAVASAPDLPLMRPETHAQPT